MSQFPGASREEWEHFAHALNLTEHLLPVVSNTAAVISAGSTLKALGKVPSRYNQHHQAVGIAKWTDHRSTAAQVRMWMQERDYGISVQCRAVRAIDIDIDDAAGVEAVLALAVLEMGALPARARDGAPRVLLAFRLAAEPGEFQKRSVERAGGLVEFLADGQQFVAAGCHPSGHRYRWTDGLPHEIPTVDHASFEAFWAALGGTAGRRAHPPGDPQSAPAVVEGGPDPVAEWLGQHGWIIGEGRDGQLNITCPWKGEHTADSGPTETAYWPAGTGGYERGHFKCLHAHCADRQDADFLEAVGYAQAALEDFSPVVSGPVVASSESAITAAPGGPPAALDADRPSGVAVVSDVSPTASWRSSEPGRGLTKGKKGYQATIRNLLIALNTDKFWLRLGYDVFRQELMCSTWNVAPEQAAWRRVQDVDLIEGRDQLERHGFEAVGRELMRDAVEGVGQRRQFDSLQLWAGQLVWDGVDRVSGFLQGHYGAPDTEYVRAVNWYWWTALAGRALDPGCQADMVPILSGPEGLRKTRGIESLAPWPEAYATVNLSARDADLARTMRGACIWELAELRGLHSRDAQDIKQFVTERVDKWTPKFKEFSQWAPRRGIFIGTDNSGEFLEEGQNRRWLPVEVSRASRLTATDRDQLWAQGIATWLMDGVVWQGAEDLARAEHAHYRMSDVWEEELARWLATRAGGEDLAGFKNGHNNELTALPHFSLHDAAQGVGLDPRAMKRVDEMRLGKCLRALGYSNRQVRVEGTNVKRWARSDLWGSYGR